MSKDGVDSLTSFVKKPQMISHYAESLVSLLVPAHRHFFTSATLQVY